MARAYASPPQSAATAADVAVASVTNRVTTRVSTVSLAGVVDTWDDLPEVPLNFKKVSTLGRLQIGDGGHDDYYLAAYDETQIGVAMRSTVDTNRMWKPLVRR